MSTEPVYLSDESLSSSPIHRWGQAWTRFKPRTRKLFLGLGVLGSTSAILFSVFFLFADGDVQVVNQRLFGQVELSSGAHSARTISDLNQLSWDNGLEILAAIDQMNSLINQLENRELSNADRFAVVNQLRDTDRSIVALLKDREILLDAANTLHSSQLFSPVFQQYLVETRERMTEAIADNDHEQLVQR